jgi:thiol-disulfide isomerase/thioredoxin
MQLATLYSPPDTFYEHYRAELLRLQQAMTDSLFALAGEMPESMAGSIVKLFVEPVFDPSEGVSYDTFMRQHYFEPVALRDPSLINTNIYTHKVVNYLGFYRSPYASQTEQEDLFIEAIDVIMQNVDYNQEVYDFILNYLIEGFERFKMEKVLVHIADFHLSGECETDNKKIMEQRLMAYQAMAPGKKVSDFVLPDQYNKAHRLSEIDSDYVLLVFWASWCPHCSQLLPRLKKWHEEEASQTGFEIVTVSIDTSRFEWEEYLMLNEMPWVNLFEQSGWEGKVARQFNIYATPTMFLLDKQRKILAKPLTFREFKHEAGKLELK